MHSTNKHFLLSPVRALYQADFYREAVYGWGVKNAALFLAYLVFFYVVALGVQIARPLSPYMGRLDDNHPFFQLLISAPPRWHLGEEGISFAAQDGSPVVQWSFENWIYVDTTQTGDFTPPADYMFVASKTLFWSPQDDDSRTVRFRDMHAKQGADSDVLIFRNAEGYFDHLEITSGDQPVRTVGRNDLKRSFGMVKALIFVVAFLILFVIFTAQKLLNALFLSLIALVWNKLSRRSLPYGRIFLISLLAQSWVLVVDIGVLLFVPLAPLRGVLSLFLSAGLVWVVFNRFLLAPEPGPTS